MHRVNRGLAGVVVAAALCLVPASASAATIAVDCSHQSLQAKINGAPPGSTLSIKGTCKGNLVVGKNLTLDGNPTATLDGQDTGSTLTLNGTSRLHLVDLVVTGGASTVGGGIYVANDGPLVLDRVRLEDNIAFGYFPGGGGIWSGEGPVTVRNSSVVRNHAIGTGDVRGGGIVAIAPVRIINSVVSDNRAIAQEPGGRAFGGAISATRMLTIASSHVDRNRATAIGSGSDLVMGGGILMSGGLDGPLSITDSTVNDNVATLRGSGSAEGGGLDASNYTKGTITRTTFARNRVETSSGNATATGGAMRIGSSPPMTILGSRIIESRVTASGSTFATALGAGVFAQGDLSVVGSRITGGRAVAQAGNNNGTAGGGGLYEVEFASKPLTVTTSTIAANHVVASSEGASSAADGGGIRSDTSTTIKRSTINGNTILSSTAAENTAAAHGGGIHLAGAVVHHVTNSTVTGNSARAVTPVGAASTTSSLGGGVYAESGLTILNATIARNAVRGSGGGTRTVSGGGLGVGAGTTTLRATILARNTSTGTGPDCPGGTISGGHNLIGHVSGCATPSATDVVGKDPKLGTLDENGGPTKTLALLAGSPARNRIGTAACAVDTDQRGVHRPQGLKCDIGAFEAKV